MEFKSVSWVSVAEVCEHGNEISVFMKSREDFDQVNGSRLC
jgi:hypothetical protein